MANAADGRESKNNPAQITSVGGKIIRLGQKSQQGWPTQGQRDIFGPPELLEWPSILF